MSNIFIYLPKLWIFAKSGRTALYERLDPVQCDQIWQNFVTLASILKSLVLFGLFLSHSAKF